MDEFRRVPGLFASGTSRSCSTREARGLEKCVHGGALHPDMHEELLATAARLSDEDLLSRLKVLAVGERDATVELVAHLAALDDRRAHLAEGPGSLYQPRPGHGIADPFAGA